MTKLRPKVGQTWGKEFRSGQITHTALNPLYGVRV